MEYKKIIKQEIIDLYKHYYTDINGGIDGYYERTILDADFYKISENDNLIAYFTIHKERGLTSILIKNSSYNHDQILSYLVHTKLFHNILFTENDKYLRLAVEKLFKTEVQAYNFDVDKKITTSFNMQRTTHEDINKILKSFGEFIEYNGMNLKTIDSFYYENDGKLISFGALEPLKLNPNRYCLSMIVNEKYRKMGYGSNTVKFLIQYVQNNHKEINARCYVLNDTSRRTLLKSGMRISNRLFKVEDVNK